MSKDLVLNPQKLIATGLGSGYFINCLMSPTTWHFIDSVDLVIHEAGHTLLRFFGEFIAVAGGSFFQVLIPLLFIIYFLHNLDYFSSSLILLWLGYNLVNLSVYIGDAIVMQLELLGGDGVIHDWNYLLTHTGLLSHTGAIAYGVHMLGIFCIITAVVLSFYFCFDKNSSTLI